MASCVFLWGLQRAVAPMRSVGGPGCWLEDLPQSSSWQAGWEPWGWSWVTTRVAASLAGLRLSACIASLCRASLQVAARAGGSLLAARGCPAVPASGLPSLLPRQRGTSAQDKTQGTTSVMLPLRCPDGERSRLSTAMRNSHGQDQHRSKGDVKCSALFPPASSFLPPV